MGRAGAGKQNMRTFRRRGREGSNTTKAGRGSVRLLYGNPSGLSDERSLGYSPLLQNIRRLKKSIPRNSTSHNLFLIQTRLCLQRSRAFASEALTAAELITFVMFGRRRNVYLNEGCNPRRNHYMVAPVCKRPAPLWSSAPKTN